VLQCTGTAAWIDVAVMLGGLPFSRGSRFPSVDIMLDKDLDMANQTTTETSAVPTGSGESSEDAEQQRLTFARRFSHNSLVSDQTKFPKRKKNKRYPGPCFHLTLCDNINTLCRLSSMPHHILSPRVTVSHGDSSMSNV
jgi:hypothetical protein